MYKLRPILFLLFCSLSYVAMAHIGPGVNSNKPGNSTQGVDFREDCKTAESQIDMSINNVRARLLTGGDVWWDLSEGKYVVPKPAPGQQEVSSIFAGAVWLGGLDPAGNLKLAATTYRNGGATDFYAGPLDPNLGSTDLEICQNWDQFFSVLAEEVDDHNRKFDQARINGQPIDCDSIPDDVKYWPGRGNPNFVEKYEFDLPDTGQGLGSFWDEDEDGDYDPCKGDFPIIDIRGCEPRNREEAKELVPDEMIFWIYNDAGGAHTLSQGNPIQMEVQVQAFAFASNDEINDMTFQRYKLINRANTDIEQTYFAMWVDPDLGCYTDDYIGCDTTRSLAYVYNEDGLDGTDGCTCDGGVNTYCETIPLLGIDYFRGPLGPKIKNADGTLSTPALGESFDTLVELGMSSFVYMNNCSVGSPDQNTCDPAIADEFYNYLLGTWRNGTAITYGGDGFNPGSVDSIEYAFTSPPDCVSDECWSMCTENLPFGDRRTLQASGPFLLKPGAINELIIGAVWVPDEDHPCPSITRLQLADDKAQNLFDNCFEIKDGPDAPDIDIVELDRELILIFTNDTIVSNNAFEKYEGVDINFTGTEENDSTYVFEGYQLYQLKNASVTAQELSDVSKAKLVRQVDIKNGVTELFNWSPALEDPTPNNPSIVWTFNKEVNGSDQGLRHTFQITDNAFAEGEDTRLINHREYYFMALAYSYNNWQEFDPRDGTGQQAPYCAGRRNIKVYTGVPRPIVFTNLNSKYGDGAAITRLSGVGAGGNFLDLADGMYDEILNGTTDGKIRYKEGAGPIDINIYNPLEVKDGNFRLILNGSHTGGTACSIVPGAKWTLEDLGTGRVLSAEKSIDEINEQIVGEYGFSITMGQTPDAGDVLTPNNGYNGSRIDYADPNSDNWLFTIRPGLGGPVTDFIADEDYETYDPDEIYSGSLFTPFVMANFRAGQYITPGWKDNGGGSFLRSLTDLRHLNNVDIVFTSDKSKWSRCVVVETFTADMSQGGLLPYASIEGAKQFDLRKSPSVGKDDNDNDGLPDPDGDGIGMGWFPGYAIDVESGKRLNIFFGENSSYNSDVAITQEVIDGEVVITEILEGGNPLGSDMMFNPSSQIFANSPNQNIPPTIWNFVAGGQHYVYVTRQEYDECALIRTKLSGPIFTTKRDPLKLVTWASIPVVPDTSIHLLSYADGLIPNDAAVKLRVDNPYNLEQVYSFTSLLNSCKTEGELPAYEFEISNKQAAELVADEYEDALSNVNVVPNPYFGFSEYEPSRLSNLVKVTNLPARAIVTIYSLDGKFIRQFNRDERGQIRSGSNPGIQSTQVYPDVVWDLKNASGIPIASGVYLIHIQAPELGIERTIKWFGVNRKFDPAGL